MIEQTRKMYLYEGELKELKSNAPRYRSIDETRLNEIGPLMVLRLPGVTARKMMIDVVESADDGLFVHVSASRAVDVKYRCRLLENENSEVVAFMDSDLQELDDRPGHYYASCVNDVGKRALLLGPYAAHMDALLAVPQAHSLLSDVPMAAWYQYGTARMNPDVANPPVGVLSKRPAQATPESPEPA